MDAAEARAGLYVMGFEACKKAVAASFLSLDLRAMLLPSEEGDEEEEEPEGAEEGEAVPSEAPAISMIEEAEPIIEEALPTAEEADAAIEVPSLINVEVIPLKGESPARGHVEVPSSS